MSKVLSDFKLPLRVLPGDRVEVDSSLFDRIQALYDSARYVGAWEVARAAGPFQRWRGSAAQVLASRLCGNIGATRTAALLISRARREYPRDPRVAVHFGYYLHERRGPLSTWHHAANVGSLDAPSPGQRADLLAQRARVASQFRDFDCAWKLIREAEDINPGSPWLATERSGILQMQERHEKALEALGEALAIREWFRPAVQHRARVLHLLGRLEEAVEFLTEAMNRIESGAVALQLWQFRRERDDKEGMLELLDQVERLTPQPEPDFTEWIAAKRADALYLGGAYSAAASEAGKVTGDYYREFSERLLALDRPGKRVRLPFTFVLQGHNTCGPATLAAIAAYWGGAIPQHEIVAAIAYDGTHDHNERRWCEENGFAATEFTVTWDSARRLLDAGIPFALATVEVESAHLQAVIGYDEVRETLLIQDPGEPNYREVTAREFLDEYVLTGPRGMAIVPPQRREEVAALDLPDGAVYTRHHEFASALANYDRDAATSILDELESEAPGHLLTRFARFSLAAFDGNSLEREKCIAEFLGDYPENPRVIHWRLQHLRESGCFEDRIALLRGTVDKPGSHPVFLRELAAELASDGRLSRDAQRFLRRAHRVFPADSSVVVELADLFWRESRDPNLLDYYRFAAARSDKHEGYARTWFLAARHHGRDGEVLDWLRRRFSDYGDRSGAPAITLADCLDHLSRTEEALRLLDEAIKRRPDDGDLLVYTARLAIRYGLVERGRGHLAKAQGRCHDGMWLRALATLHQRLGETGDALATWQRVLEREPLAVDGHRAVAHHLSLLVGESAASVHLKEACERFPHHAGLAEIRLARLRDVQPEEALGVARQLVAILPANAWARRELAILLDKTGRPEEALVEAMEALAIAPRDPASHGVAASLLSKAGRHEKASGHLRTSIELDVNYGWAVDELVNLQRNTGAKREILDFVRGEMVRQVLDGNMLHSYRSTAYSVVNPSELLEQLREVWEARPDLWESWSVLAAQALDTGDGEEALRLSREATERFPLLPGAWRDLAQIHRLRGERVEAIAAIRRAVELNPDWELAWRMEAEYLEETGRPEEAIATLERAVRRLPTEGAPRAVLAAMLWRAGRLDEAWEVGSKLAVEDPGFDFIWDQLGQWASVTGRRAEVVRLARQVADDRPGEARSWMILAKALPLAEVAGELEAYAKAIELNPRLEEAYDLKAVALARSGRLDEAAKCLRSGPWDGHHPASLEGRLAWLESVRGDTAKALAEMSAVLERNCDYYWGWERCAEWAEATGDREAWRRAVRELIRLAPGMPRPVSTPPRSKRNSEIARRPSHCSGAPSNSIPPMPVLRAGSSSSSGKSATGRGSRRFPPGCSIPGPPAPSRTLPWPSPQH